MNWLNNLQALLISIARKYCMFGKVLLKVANSSSYSSVCNMILLKA